VIVTALSAFWTGYVLSRYSGEINEEVVLECGIEEVEVFTSPGSGSLKKLLESKQHNDVGVSLRNSLE